MRVARITANTTLFRVAKLAAVVVVASEVAVVVVPPTDAVVVPGAAVVDDVLAVVVEPPAAVEVVVVVVDVLVGASHVVSAPDALSPAALVNPAPHAVQTLLTTFSFAAHVIAVHVMSAAVV